MSVGKGGRQIISADDTLPMGEAARESWRFRQRIMAERRATAEPAQTVVKVGSDDYVLASSLATRRANQVLASIAAVILLLGPWSMPAAQVTATAQTPNSTFTYCGPIGRGESLAEVPS